MNKNSHLNDVVLNYIIIVLIVLFCGYFLYFFHVFERVFPGVYFGQNYNFISPFLKYNEKKTIKETENPFYKQELETIVNGFLNDSGVKNISLYFRDLNNGYVFGINERELFKPASLTKVPTMMAILKKSEEDFGFLDKKINVDFPNVDYYLYYPPSSGIVDGGIYSVRDLLGYMIKYSDNNATQILRQLLGKKTYKSVYQDLKIEFVGDDIEVVDYSSLFRILFNSSYLQSYNSEFALKLLSEVDFDYGLKKEIPIDVKIAHKFGEYTIDGKIKQLHDCGIVYYPQHPYVLCVMTRGNDYKKLENIIFSLSRYLFEKIDYTYGK